MKKILSTAGATTGAAALLLTATSGQAAFADDDTITYPTEGSVNFVQADEDDDETSGPVDPTNPDEEVDFDDDDDVTPPTGGPLSINYASDLDFGEVTASWDDVSTYASADERIGESAPNSVQVQDRRISQDGWTLSVEASDFENESGATLDGAQITFENANLIRVGSDQDVDSDAYEEEFTATPGAPYGVVNFEEGTGGGTYVYYFGDEDTADASIRLDVPGDAEVEEGDYTADINWLLEDTPSGLGD